MDLPNLALDSVAVVVKGYFNPALFSSGWMLSRGLITAQDAVDAKQQAATPDVAIFETSWFRLFSTRDSLNISTVESEDFERVRDLTVGILKDLPETPIAVMGINRDVHFTVSSKKEWHSIGDRLAPKDIWSGVLREPGTATLGILSLRSDEYSGHVQVTVQPSARFPLGIFVSHNDHYSLEEGKPQLKSRDELTLPSEITADDVDPKKSALAVRILNEMWSDSMNRSAIVFERIADQAKN
jgi:hypothetical protein